MIQDVAYIDQFKAGEILVTDITTPDWEPVMKIASAIITNRGGRTCHAAIIARELGIPAIVGCPHATKELESNPEVTVSCAEGDTGKVYLANSRLKFMKPTCRIWICRRPTSCSISATRRWRFKPASSRIRRRTGENGVHHQRVGQGPSACPTATGKSHRQNRSRTTRRTHQRLR